MSTSRFEWVVEGSEMVGGGKKGRRLKCGLFSSVADLVGEKGKCLYGEAIKVEEVKRKAEVYNPGRQPGGDGCKGGFAYRVRGGNFAPRGRDFLYSRNGTCYYVIRLPGLIQQCCRASARSLHMFGRFVFSFFFE